jgi:hypothetical protein
MSSKHIDRGAEDIISLAEDQRSGELLLAL